MAETQIAGTQGAAIQGAEAGRKPKKPRVRPPQTFRHFKPEDQTTGKAMVRLCQSDLNRGVVQVVKHGEGDNNLRSEEHTSELTSLMRTYYANFCLNKQHINK